MRRNQLPTLLTPILQAGVCHFSDYGLMDYPYHIFLPLIIR